MHIPKPLLILITLLFSALSAYAVWEVGYMGVVDQFFANPAAWQIAADLVIALTLVAGWMIRDARATGRNVWPYIAVTLALGSIGPLAYLWLAPARASQQS